MLRRSVIWGGKSAEEFCPPDRRRLPQSLRDTPAGAVLSTRMSARLRLRTTPPFASRLSPPAEAQTPQIADGGRRLATAVRRIPHAHKRCVTSQVLAQALQSSDGERLADDLHRLEQRRGDATAGYGHANRAEGETRLVPAILHECLVQGLVQVVGLPIGLVHALKRGDGGIEHVGGGVLELLPGIVRRLQVLLGGQQGADHAGDLAQQAHARLDQRSGGGQDGLLAVSQRIPIVGRDHTVAVQVRHGTVEEVLRLKHADVLGVDGDGLVDVEAGRVGLHVAHVELGDHLVHGEHVTVGGDGPAEQSQVVEQTLADETVVAVVEQVGLRVALGELLVALAHHVRHVAEQRHLLGDAKLHQVAVQHDLTRGGAEQVLAAQHDVDVHHRVVDRVGERVQRIAVRAHDDIVRHGTGKYA